MSLRPRPTPSKQTSISDTSAASTTDGAAVVVPEQQLTRQPSLSRRAISQTLTGTANLANLLPTGTLLAFQLLTPVFTNNGHCDGATGAMTLILLLLLSLSCLIASFTDSVKSSTDGRVYYGLATFRGLWLFDYYPPADGGRGDDGSFPDLRKYRLRLIDGVHAVMSVMVFGAVALRDKNVVGCFYPAPAPGTQEVLNIVPVGVGVICSLLFMVFPTRRHGIGYPVTSDK